MKKLIPSSFVAFLFVLLVFSSCFAEERLLFMAGAASKPVVEELVKGFEKKTGIKVDANIGGSGMLLSQMKLSKKGDVYFPGSIDFIERAKKDGVINESTVTQIVYLVPSICVQKGNPKNIKSLKDLCKPGLKVIIAHPESVCLGVFAVELFEKLFNAEEKKAVRENILSYAESCEKTASSIALKSCDAVVGWGVFEHWNPELIETVKLDPSEIIRISYLAVATTKYAQNPKTAQQFIDYMKSPEGLEHFKKFQYFTTPEEALKYVGQAKPVGGNEYTVPPEWLSSPKK